MTISKGSSYGEPGVALPGDGVLVRSDREARHVLETCRRDGQAFPVLGLLGGDLCRTLAGPGDEARLRSSNAVTFPVDVGQVLVDGRLHLFVAHAVLRNRWWTRAIVAMNAQWHGSWNLGPKGHPNDGILDVYDATLTTGDLWKVRARLPSGTHLPHPRIIQQRTKAAQFDLPKPMPLWLDGERVDEGRRISFRIEPDALRVVV